MRKRGWELGWVDGGAADAEGAQKRPEQHGQVLRAALKGQRRFNEEVLEQAYWAGLWREAEPGGHVN